MSLTRIAHFSILGKLGQGGMGVVFRAEDTKLRRPVALKLLRPEDVADPERRARFVREAQAAAAVTHPNIATVYEIGEDEAGRVFIAMELVEGTTLRDRLSADGRLGVSEALTLMREITRGLGKAHAAGLVHRDLKPDNLMIGREEGAVKILDFGLAKMRELASPSVLAFAATGEYDTPPITEAGLVMGTPGYMSPEQATGKPVDARSDVFALGIILFEMLTGKLPFRGATVGELLIAGVRDAPRNLRELAPDVSDSLASVVTACLEKSPDARPADARALHQQLVDCTSGVGFAETERAAVTDPPPPDPAPPPRRSRALLLIPVAIAVAVCLVVAVQTRTPPAVAAVDASTKTGGGLLDLPVPIYCNDAARIEYRAALEVSRGRGLDFGNEHFDLALKADPQCPEAHLRAALHGQFGSAARDHYNRATILRDKLTAPDRELLEAYAPFFMEEPSNYAESRRRLLALEKTRPRDAELLIFIGYSLWGQDPGNVMTQYGERVLAIDPEFSAGYQLLGAARLRVGDNEGARKALEQCERVIPSAVDCVFEETRLAQSTGRCADMERHARALTKRLPSGDRHAYSLVARALAATDQGRPAVAEALRQAASNATPESEALAQLELARLALAYGDFDSALTTLADVQKAIDTSDNIGHHATTVQLEFELNLELGRPTVALSLAQTFAARAKAWSGSVSEYYGNGEEGFLLVPRMLGLQFAAGTLTADRRDAELATWITKRELVGDPRARWLAAYSASAQTAVDAEKAVAVMPRSDGAVAAPIIGMPSAMVGRILARGGRPAEGVTELRRFTQRCERLDQPIAQTQAYLWLGEALEATNAPADACTAYGVVRARWTDARSLSARRAADRMKALDCGSVRP